MLRVECLTSISEVEAIAGKWDDLLGRSHNNSLMMNWAWISQWLKVYLKSNTLLCLVVYDDQKLVGIAPHWIHKQRILGLGRVKVLRFIGSEEVCGDHLDLIISRKNTEAICKVIWEQLNGPLRSRWDIWEYQYVPAYSPILHALCTLSDNDPTGLGMIFAGYTICPYVSLPSSWDAYVSSLSANQRRALNISTDLLNKTGDLDLQFCDSREEIPAFMQTHIELHRASWQERGKSGSFATEAFRQFHLDLARNLFDRGQLFLCNLLLKGAPIGSFYGFSHDKVLYYYLLGAKREIVPGASVGRVLLGRCIKAAIERGFVEFDMLRGYEDYKYHWTDRERRELLITFYNRSFGALAYILTRFAIRFGKQAGKTFLGQNVSRLKRWRAGTKR